MRLKRAPIMAWVAALPLAALLAACLPVEETSPTSAPPAGIVSESATVTQVIDGDTIDVRIGGDTYRVRYIGVNTPEYNQLCSAEATQANAALVQGQTVTLVKDVSETDPYERLLRYVYVGDLFVNAELVAEGYAESVRYPPDTAYATFFDTLEADARRAGLGCHPTGVFR
jgi:micrococcal nuclease